MFVAKSTLTLLCLTQMADITPFPTCHCLPLPCSLGKR